MLLSLSACKNKTTDKTLTAEDTLSTAILQVKECARLYVTEVRIHKIVTFDDVSHLKGSFFSKDFDIKLPLGSRKVAIPIDTTLKAWIDFSRFSKDNVIIDTVNGRHLTIILPDPQIILTSTKVDNAGTREYISWLRSRFSDAELTEFTRQGQEAISKDVDKMNLLSTCRLHATRVLIPIFTRMGYKESDIVITFQQEVTDHADWPILNKIYD